MHNAEAARVSSFVATEAGATATISGTTTPPAKAKPAAQSGPPVTAPPARLELPAFYTKFPT